MAFVQKTWKDRVAEYINRRILTKEDGTTELVSVERSEGTISQEGDAFSAENMNDLEQRIANEFSEQNKKFDVETVTISSGVILTRYGKIRILSVTNPSITSSTIKLPLETDYPATETSATGRISSGTLGMIYVKTNGDVAHIQLNGSTTNFTSSSRYSVMWVVN